MQSKRRKASSSPTASINFTRPGQGAWWGALVSLILVLIGLALAVYLQISGAVSLAPPPHMFFSTVTTFAFSITGALIASRRPRNPIGWLFEAVGFLSALILFSAAYFGIGQITMLPGEDFFLWAQTWVWIPTVYIPVTFLLLLFPNGRLPSKHWWPVLISAVVGLLGVLISIGFNPDQSLQEGLGLPAPNPYALSGMGTVLTFGLKLSGLFMVIAVFGATASMIVRFRLSRGVLRTQLKWLVYAGVFVLGGVIVASTLASIYPGEPNIEELTIIIVDLVVSGVALATGVAILRYRLYDINLLFNRTIVYGILTLSIVGMYILSVGFLGSLFQSRADLIVSLVATGFVAVLFQPLRERLQRGVNLMMYGARDEPYMVISRLGRRLESTLAPESILPTITTTIAQALKLPYVAIILTKENGIQTAAAIGEPRAETQALPLRFQSDEFGQLLFSPRSPGEYFSVGELNLLTDIARQASIAVHTTRLTSDLLRAHRRLVRAREEERRRIRRDLHDGLGPILASCRLKIGSAIQMLRRKPEEAQDHLRGVEMGLTTAIDEIRRLVYDLRPPALDELGLVRAIKQDAPQVPNLEILYDTPEIIPGLPAAVDVAAYRIIQEALNNCVRHARASKVTVEIKAGEQLELSIQDNGDGLPDNYRPGIGLRSMRERAEELGGTFDVRWAKGEGTRVHVRLPLEESEL